MLRILKNKKAQNTIEYALLIAVVIGAFTAMQLYNRRSINMRVKRGMDKIPFAIMGLEENTSLGGDGMSLIDVNGSSILGTEKDDMQYEPYYYAKGQYEMTTNSTEGREEGNITPTTGTRGLISQTTQRTGLQEVTGTDKVDW